MSEFKVRTSQSTESNGVAIEAALNFRKAQVVVPDVLQWVLEGRVFTANVGTLTAPATLAETTITSLQPALAVRVPASITVIPIYTQIIWEATGAAVMEALIRMTNKDFGAGTSTAVTPVNLNSAYASTQSTCTVGSLYSGNGSVDVSVEIKRFIAHSDMDGTTVIGVEEGAIYDPFNGKGPICVLKGPATYLVHAANATSSTGFVIAHWAEFRTADVGI